MKWTAWWSLALVGIMTTGCGGGGASGSKESANDNIVSSAVQEVSAVSGDCAPLNGFFSELLALTNDARQDAGLRPLRSSYQLGQAAQEYAEDLGTQNFFSHQGKDGSTLSSRVADTGYEFATAGENIAAGQRSARNVFRGWMNSDGHRANILQAEFTEVGFGLYDATGSSDYGMYWVQNFGKPSGGASEAGHYIPDSCGRGTFEADGGGETRVAGVSVDKEPPTRALPNRVAVDTLSAGSQANRFVPDPLATALSNQISMAANQSEKVPEPAVWLGLAGFGLAAWRDRHR